MSIYAGHVLVVDDDPVILTICSRMLAAVHFHVTTCAHPEEIEQLIVQTRFDLILLDLYMPVMDGLTLLEVIRRHDLNVPIVIITGMATLDQAAQAMRLGAHGLLLKPFSPLNLQQTVIDILQQRRAVRTYDRVQALRPLVHISRQLLAQLDLPILYDQIIETVRRELSADRASLMLLADESLRIEACAGLPEGVRVGKRVSLTAGLAGWVASNGQPIRVDNEGTVIPPHADLRGVLPEDRIVTAISVPLIAGTQILGVLNAGKTVAGLPFNDADQELLELLASHAAIAIESARLYRNVAYSEARYRALLHHATDAVFLLDQECTRVLDANPAFEQLSGYTRTELLGMLPQHLLLHFETMAKAGGAHADQWYQRAVPEFNTQANGHELRINEIETVLYMKDGRVLSIAMSMSPVHHEGEDFLLVIARDSSERQRIARQLAQTEKLAAVGRLAASLAHEINNPLQAIHNSLHLLINRPLTEEKRQLYLAMTQTEVTQMITMVRRLLDFYRPTLDGMLPTNLHESLDVVLGLVEKECADHHVVIVRDLQPNLPLVQAVGNHIKQLYVNMILNAIEAMPDGGVLTIRTYSIDQPEPAVNGFGVVGHRIRGPSVIIEFSNTGQGIAPDDLSQIFEPFYTPRNRQNGSLSLAVSYTIVEQHQGELSVSSPLGQGATFRVRLPLVNSVP